MGDVSQAILDPSDLFTPGPSFDGAPSGDAERQAIDSLRGYAYQIAASTAAWLDLDNTARLYLEVAEDYATVAADSLKTVQVKDTKGSGAITLNSQNVRDAIDHYVNLVALNPQRAVQFHYLTTSDIAAEHRVEDRPAGEAGLLYWRKAASGADVKPLRSILESPNFSDDVHQFVQGRRDDEALRRDLLRNIHWQCGQPNFLQLLREVEDRLVVLGTDRYRLTSPDSARLTNVLMYHVLKKSILDNANDRVLTRAELDRAVSAATAVTLQRPAVDAIVAANAVLTEALTGGGPAALTLSSAVTWLVPSSDIPRPPGLITRPARKKSVVEVLKTQGLVFAFGTTGVGKSLLARDSAQEFGGDFVLADLRDATAAETRARLNGILGRLGSTASRALLIEDLNHLEDPSVLLALGAVASALKRRDRVALVTSYRAPSARALSELGLDAQAVVEVPYFSEEEVKAVVQANGGDSEIWGRVAYLAGGNGHPQLVHAFVTGMAMRGWPKAALKDIVTAGLTSEDVDAARDAARRQLVAALPEGTRKLLYRLSLVIGRFDRALALALGALPPPLAEPGEQLDRLIGSWVEFVSKGYFRVSPLVASAGRETLQPEEQQAVHNAIVIRTLSERTINIADANVVFSHALLGRSKHVLFGLATSVLTANTKVRKDLREWFFLLRYARTDRLIYPENPTIARMLRLAQFKLVAEGPDSDEISACVTALLKESAAGDDQELNAVFEILVLGTVLGTMGIADHLPNWIDLLLRMKEVIESSNTRYDLKAGFEAAQAEASANNYSMLFCVGVAGLSSVKRLQEIFASLDALTQDLRSLLLEAYERVPGDYHVLVSAPWLAAQRKGVLDYADAASRYSRMAESAYRWGLSALAAECYAARSVMLDEYGEDAAAALRSLDDADAVLGENVVLSRARAKVLWRHNDHVGAVAIMRLIANRISPDSPIARCFALREAAISAAKTDDWAQAERWFDEAKTAGGQAKADDMPPMAIGLGVDAAIAAFQTGNRAGAIERMADSLVALRTLDPDSSLRAAYCHRVARHAVLWLETQIEGRATLIDNQPIQLPPGTCSNPEPPPAIKELPLGPVDLAWYMLAQAEIALGEDLGIVKSLREKLEKGPIPVFEVMLRGSWMQHAIKSSDAQIFAPYLGDWLEGMAYLRSSGASLRETFQVLDPARGEIPSLSPSRRSEDYLQASAADAIISFLIVSALEGRKDIASLLKNRLRDESGDAFPGSAVFELLETTKAPERNLEQVAAVMIRMLRAGEHLEPLRLWEVGLRLFEKARQSNFNNIVVPVLAVWMRAQWLRIISRESFRLPHPMVTIPKVEAAMKNKNNDERFIAALCLSAADAVGAPLASEYRQLLRGLAAS
jgi:hypothetical protein